MVQSDKTVIHPWGRLAALLLVLPLGVPAAAAPARKTVVSPRAPRPAAAAAQPRLLSLAITPPLITLSGQDGRQQLVVTGRYADGLERDLTHQVAFSVSVPGLVRVERARLTPIADGSGMLVARAPGGARAWASVRVTGAGETRSPGFTHHVVPVLNKFGCAQGSCHGSFSGRGGLRLSLFGHDPDMDYNALVRLGGARRVSRTDPTQSLLLRKPTLAVAHAGGHRFAADSRAYRLLAEWVAYGCRYPKDEARLEALEVYPSERMLLKDTEQQLVVTARYSDGSREDVTELAKYGTQHDEIAAIEPDGRVRAVRVGEAAVTVEFLGRITTMRILVPSRMDLVHRYPPVPRGNFVDEQVVAKLRKLGIVPSDLAGDAEFLRRVSLDLCGVTPTANEVRKFLADPDPAKRSRKIDELLERDEYNHHWATFLCDLTGNDNRFLPTPRETAAQRWHLWFYTRLKENASWDRIARGVVAATSREDRPLEEWLRAEAEDQRLRAAKGPEKWDASHYTGRSTLDIYWLKSGNDPVTIARQISYTFLGVKLECAECHKHPYDRWTQADYKGFTAFFQRVTNGMSADTRREATERKLPVTGVPEVRFDPTRRGSAPQFLDGPTLAADAPDDPRVALADWMARPENPFFARAIVNRIWARHLGRGIVDPPDAFSAANPPTNPALLDALARDFVTHGFDLKHLHRVILNSRTYQLSFRTNPTNETDVQNFSHYPVKQLSGEALLDAANQVTGGSEDWGIFAPPGTRAVAVPASRLPGTSGYVLKAFGRPTRSQSCDCERAEVPGLPQALYLINDGHLQGKIAAPKGTLHTLLKSGMPDGELVEELYLSALGRLPRSSETQTALEHVRQAPGRNQGFEDVLWALFNTREFITNH